MNELTLQAMDEIKSLADNTPDGKHIVTGDIRKLSARLYRKIDDKAINHVFALCEEFLEQHTWALGVISFDWAYRVREQYNEHTYDVFYRWLKKYVRGWGDCDDFCTHAFGELLRKEKALFQKGYGWMLKSLSQVDMDSVREYLIANHSQMPRIAYRYALEKFDKETRKELMAL